MIVGFAGFAGVGKSTAADFCVENFGFRSLSFAEPLKRLVQRLYDFSDEQMYGPSRYRDEPDSRYSRGYGTYLTPRLALERFGTEAGRFCYKNTWCDQAMRMAKGLLDCDHVNGVALSDARFINEFEAIRAAGGYVVRLVRDDIVCGDHESETEQAALPDSYFDLVLDTSGSKSDTQQVFTAWYLEKQTKAA